MLNNKEINELKQEKDSYIKLYEEEKELFEKAYKLARKNRSRITELTKDVEEKENKIINLLEENDDLSLDNMCLREKIDKLEQVIEKKDLIICELNVKLCVSNGKLDKIQNYCRMTEGREFKQCLR